MDKKIVKESEMIRLTQLTCIIPIHNCEKNLSRCIESILKIKNFDIEIMLIDDGSIDGSLEICKRYQRKYNQIQVIHQENKGVSEARNVGIRKATGKYISFIDSDDEIILEGYTDFLYSDRDKDLYIYNYCLNSKDNLVKREINSRDLLVSILYKNNNAVWDNFYKREIIINNNIFFDKDMKMGEDLLFNIKYIQYIKNVEINDKAMYLYFNNNIGSAVNTKKTEYLYNYVNMFDTLFPFYQKTEYKKNIDWDIYIHGVFSELFHKTEEGEHKKLVTYYEKSNLCKEIQSGKAKGIKAKLKKFLLKTKSYHWFNRI